MGKNYVPGSDAAFDPFFKNVCQYAAQKCGGQTPQWIHVPQTAQTELNNAYAAGTRPMPLP